MADYPRASNGPEGTAVPLLAVTLGGTTRWYRWGFNLRSLLTGRRSFIRRISVR